MTDPGANPFAMTVDEIYAFLNGAPRYGTLATLRRSGSPITDGIGFEWDGECLYFSIRDTRAMLARLKRDPRVCVHVMNDTYPPMWVRMEGVAEPIEDPDYERSLRIMRRYMDPSSPGQTLEEFDIGRFEQAYVGVGRTVHRLRPEVLRSHDAHKYGDRHEEIGGGGSSDHRRGR